MCVCGGGGGGGHYGIAVKNRCRFLVFVAAWTAIKESRHPI